LAQALLTDPRVIAAEAPFRALGSAASDWLWSLFKNAIEGRQLVVSFDEAVLDSRALIREFDQVVLLHTGKLVAVGPPSEVLQAGAYLVSVTRRAASFRRELEAQGCEVRATKLDDELPSQLLIRASGQDLAGIIARTATQHEIPVIELVPLPRAPSGSSGSDVGRAI
jgi:ABC-type multidrug transport system ATPase subunit